VISYSGNAPALKPDSENMTAMIAAQSPGLAVLHIFYPLDAYD